MVHKFSLALVVESIMQMFGQLGLQVYSSILQAASVMIRSTRLVYHCFSILQVMPLACKCDGFYLSFNLPFVLLFCKSDVYQNVCKCDKPFSLYCLPYHQEFYY